MSIILVCMQVPLGRLALPLGPRTGAQRLRRVQRDMVFHLSTVFLQRFSAHRNGIGYWRNVSHAKFECMRSTPLGHDLTLVETWLSTNDCLEFHLRTCRTRVAIQQHHGDDHWRLRGRLLRYFNAALPVAVII